MNGKQNIKCPKCNRQIVFFDTDEDITIDSMGEDIREEALENLKQNRIVCDKCKINFCSKCNSIPFHESMTCEEYELVKKNNICRFCREYPAIGCEGLDPCNQVCWHQECQESLHSACNHLCECGHACCGVAGETDHFGCAICNNSLSICSICKSSCTTSPSVIMKCGHPAHKSCLISLYESLSEEGRIILPKCSYNLICEEIPYHECVQDAANKWIKIADEINEAIKIRMGIEDIQSEPDHVNNPLDGYYYHQPEKFAHDFFVFNFCDKCHSILYSGRKNCEEEKDEENEDKKEEEDKNEEEEDKNVPTLCLKCRNEQSKICPIHGEIAMVFKCMFCCNPTLYRCFGQSTYFCNKCHQHWSSAQQPPFPKCDGKCQFGKHPLNGERCIFGYCALCRAEKEKNDQE